MSPLKLLVCDSNPEAIAEAIERLGTYPDIVVGCGDLLRADVDVILCPSPGFSRTGLAGQIFGQLGGIRLINSLQAGTAHRWPDLQQIPVGQAIAIAVPDTVRASATWVVFAPSSDSNPWEQRVLNTNSKSLAASSGHVQLPRDATLTNREGQAPRAQNSTFQAVRAALLESLKLSPTPARIGLPLVGIGNAGLSVSDAVDGIIEAAEVVLGIKPDES